jgi:hypothetical protein
VKSRYIALRLVVSVFAVSSLLAMIGCQSVEIAPYTKYASDAEVPRISLEDAKKDFDAGNAVIIDARGDMAWGQEHIAGSMSSGKIGPVEQDYPNIPRGKKIIVYCS